MADAPAEEDSQVPKRKEPAPITAEGQPPQKRFYRQRAHCNPLSHNDAFDYPVSPDRFDWKEIYVTSSDPPTVLDIGCGFGNLTLHLAQLLKDERVLGLEIRSKVAEFVRLRIVNARQEATGHDYQNCAVHRTNTMKFLVNYFAKSSLNKLFVCFPDPHFKRKNHPRRIISTRLLSEYAFVLKSRARLYCITDVLELHEWHVQHLEAHPLFRRVESADDDPCVEAMRTVTEEGQKVERNGGSKYYAVYERIPDSECPEVTAENFFS